MVTKTPTVYSTIRSILTADINLPADQVVEKVQASGVKASADSIRNQVYTVRSQL